MDSIFRSYFSILLKSLIDKNIYIIIMVFQLTEELDKKPRYNVKTRVLWELSKGPS